MEKRSLVIFVLLVVSFGLLLFSNNVYSANETVCGQPANSIAGYGQVVIWDVVYSCNNLNDSFCPEDYQNGSNTAVYGDCSRCHDPDCTGTVSGFVRNYLNVPLGRANVTIHPIRFNLSVPSLERSAQTDSNGEFVISSAVTGTYYIGASYSGLDTELKEITVLKGDTTAVNFNLVNGTCYEDCTNSYGRCNAACSGLTFSNGGVCTFYNSTTMNLCDNRLKGTQVLIPGTGNGTHVQVVDCCEGVPYFKYYQTLNVSVNNSVKNLAKFEKLVRYNEQPAKIIVAYWPSN